jgi:hypothetical protein
MGTGGLAPGDIQTYQVLALTATDVEEWSFKGEEFLHFPDHGAVGAEPIQGAFGFGLTLDVPTIVRLVARSFVGERLPDIAEGDRLRRLVPGAAHLVERAPRRRVLPLRGREGRRSLHRLAAMGSRRRTLGSGMSGGGTDLRRRRACVGQLPLLVERVARSSRN